MTANLFGEIVLRQSASLTVIFVLSFLIGSGLLYAQESTRRSNSIYVELAGHGILYSINYDRLLLPAVSMKVGFSTLDGESSSGISHRLRAVPITVNYIFGKTPFQLELGTGVDFISFYLDDVSWRLSDKWGMAVIHSVMWRIQPEDGGLNIRMGLTPAWGRRFFLYGGVSIGWTF